MNKKELKQKSEKELIEELSKAEKELEKVISDILQKKEKNVKKPGRIKKEIARIKTLLHLGQLGKKN